MHKADILRMLKKQGFSEEIVKAFESVNREDFVPKELKQEAYKDTALPIGFGQTISQPYTIAFMLSLLQLEPEKKYKILEIGSGSGYVLALLNKLSPKSEIYGVERIKELADGSSENLPDSVEVINRDGSKGLPEKGPFDRILVSAAFADMPSHLERQLKVGGILVAPVRSSIFLVQRQRKQSKVQEFQGFAFVPVVEG